MRYLLINILGFLCQCKILFQAFNIDNVKVESDDIEYKRRTTAVKPNPHDSDEDSELITAEILFKKSREIESEDEMRSNSGKQFYIQWDTCA